MNINSDVFLAIGLLLLALEHFGMGIPPVVTGIVLLVVAAAMLF